MRLQDPDLQDIHEDMQELLNTKGNGTPPTFYELKLMTSIATMSRTLDRLAAQIHHLHNDLHAIKP
jgi:hypothetical protein